MCLLASKAGKFTYEKSQNNIFEQKYIIGYVIRERERSNSFATSVSLKFGFFISSPCPHEAEEIGQGGRSKVNKT